MRIVEATEIVLDLASQQWGLVTTAQATAQGVSPVTLGRLVDRAVLARIRSGVYASESVPWSPVMGIRGQWLALEPPILAADRLGDPTPVLVSHESAAALHQMGDLDSHGVHFTVASRRQTRQSDVIFHIADVPAQDWAVLDGLPVTTPLRTVVDLAHSGHEPDHLADMLATIFDRRLATREEAAGALVEVADLLGIARHDRVGVSAWLEERFPQADPPEEAMLRRHIDAALAPIQEQMRVLLEQISPQPEAIAHLAAAIRNGFAGSEILRQHSPQATGNPAEVPHGQPAISGPSTSVPHGQGEGKEHAGEENHGDLDNHTKKGHR